MDERLVRAEQAWQRAVFEGAEGAIAPALADLGALQADVDLARGRLQHARSLHDRVADPTTLSAFEAAAGGYERAGDQGGLARALFMVGVWHQVVAGDDAAAAPVFERAAGLAATTGQDAALADVLRHQAHLALAAGALDRARRLMQRSTDLRRALGLSAGVALNLVSAAEIEHAAGRVDRAQALLDDAEHLAQEVGARTAVEMVGQVRATW